VRTINASFALHMLHQASSYSAVAAERATHLGKAAADYSEGARSQLAGLHLPDTLANLQVGGCHSARRQCQASFIHAGPTVCRCYEQSQAAACNTSVYHVATKC